LSSVLRNQVASATHVSAVPAQPVDLFRIDDVAVLRSWPQRVVDGIERRNARGWIGVFRVRRRRAANPRREPLMDVAAAGHARQIVEPAEQTELSEALKDPEIERRASNAAA
jgi:hypothetical protein